MFSISSVGAVNAFSDSWIFPRWQSVPVLLLGSHKQNSWLHKTIRYTPPSIIQGGRTNGRIMRTLVLSVLFNNGLYFFKNLFILPFFLCTQPGETRHSKPRCSPWNSSWQNTALRHWLASHASKERVTLCEPHHVNDLAGSRNLCCGCAGRLGHWVTQLTIIINLIILLVLSAQLTLFVLLFIPIMGFYYRKNNTFS